MSEDKYIAVGYVNCPRYNDIQVVGFHGLEGAWNLLTSSLLVLNEDK
ncbi:MAG: hypothetical protein R6W73_03845 [Candidatus Saliniplasma sp.]